MQAPAKSTVIFRVTVLPYKGSSVTQSINLETRLLLSLEAKRLPVFTTEDAKKILGTGDSSVWHILHGLASKKRIERIERGKYLLVPAAAGPELLWSEYPWVIVPRLVEPYYVGFWTAMNLWCMTEQIPYTVLVATTKRKRRIEYVGQRFEFVTLAEKKFFGFVQKSAGSGKQFNVSSREKTIVDGLTHPQYCGGIVEMAKAMWNARKDVSWPAVLEAAERVGVDVVVKRLGYLLSVLDIEKEIAGRIAKMEKTSVHLLDPLYPRVRTTASKEYGLAVNITRAELLDWMYH